MFARLIQLVADVCLFRRGPQDLPFRPAVTLALIPAALAVETWNASMFYGRTAPVASILLSGAFLVGVVWAILRLRGREARFWQTLLALVSTTILFALLTLPLVMMVGPVDPDNIEAIPPVFAGLIVALAIWRILVGGHVWRHALDVPLPLGVLVFIATFMVELVLQGAMAGLSGGAASR